MPGLTIKNFVLFRLLGVIVLGLTTLSCSLPNLETAQCAEARNTVKRFYSLHFAEQQTPGPEYARAREELLSGRLADQLKSAPDGGPDYFTAAANFPKAFRVGACSNQTDAVADLQVVLLWRDDIKNEQREVTVHTRKIEENWVIDAVGN